MAGATGLAGMLLPMTAQATTAGGAAAEELLATPGLAVAGTRHRIAFDCTTAGAQSKADVRWDAVITHAADRKYVNRTVLAVASQVTGLPAQLAPAEPGTVVRADYINNYSGQSSLLTGRRTVAEDAAEAGDVPRGDGHLVDAPVEPTVWVETRSLTLTLTSPDSVVTTVTCLPVAGTKGHFVVVDADEAGPLVCQAPGVKPWTVKGGWETAVVRKGGRARLELAIPGQQLPVGIRPVAKAAPAKVVARALVDGRRITATGKVAWDTSTPGVLRPVLSTALPTNVTKRIANTADAPVVEQLGYRVTVQTASGAKTFDCAVMEQYQLPQARLTAVQKATPASVSVTAVPVVTAGRRSVRFTAQLTVASSDGARRASGQTLKVRVRDGKKVRTRTVRTDSSGRAQWSVANLDGVGKHRARVTLAGDLRTENASAVTQWRMPRHGVALKDLRVSAPKSTGGRSTITVRGRLASTAPSLKARTVVEVSKGGRVVASTVVKSDAKGRFTARLAASGTGEHTVRVRTAKTAERASVSKRAQIRLR